MDAFNIYQRFTDEAREANLDFILIGGHAVNVRGYVRTTLDFDFMVRRRDLHAWVSAMEKLDYRLHSAQSAFAQFAPRQGERIPVDLMLVDDATFERMHAASDRCEYGERDVQVVSCLHLIALKLHALRSKERDLEGKDFLDVVTLVRGNSLDVQSPEFVDILNRYGTAEIRERLIAFFRPS